MSYTRPSATAANATWSGATAYTRPPAVDASVTWGDGIPPPPVERTRVLSGIRAPWAAAQPSRSLTTARAGITNKAEAHKRVPWSAANPQRSPQAVPWGRADTADQPAALPWGRYASQPRTRTAALWLLSATADRGAVSPWGRYTRTPAGAVVSPWLLSLTADRHAVAPWGVYRPAGSPLAAIIGPSTPLNPWWHLPWLRYSRPLNPGWGIPSPDGGPPTDENGTIVVPVLRTYIVINSVSLTRVSNNLALPPLALQISIDADSWGWGWSSTLEARYLADLEPDAPGEPVELEAQINGQAWRLLLERISRDRRFGSDRLSVSGRGIAARLADPIYPAESRDNTAGALTSQQLAAAALEHNGVPLGWSLDWQIPDWLVPAGAWVHTGTPIDAVTRIAQAAGGYVQADPTEQTLHVLPRYPDMPWEWPTATPDYTLPSAVTTREATQYIELPSYNVVFVSGTAVGGINGRVWRSGTAADLPAEMIVDPLITHADAARGRGRSVLGNTGAQQLLTLETPILPDIGLYPVGALIQWHEGATTRRGIVRSCAVSASLPKVRQIIEVECHG